MAAVEGFGWSCGGEHKIDGRTEGGGVDGGGGGGTCAILISTGLFIQEWDGRWEFDC